MDDIFLSSVRLDASFFKLNATASSVLPDFPQSIVKFVVKRAQESMTVDDSQRDPMRIIDDSQRVNT